jgi:hypothetical protein
MMWLPLAVFLLGLAAIYKGFWDRSRAPKLVGLGLVVAGPVWAWATMTVGPDEAPLDPHPQSELQIVAMGDSYMSGEGVERYFLGTDDPGRNKCHRSSDAYPYLVAEELGASLAFAACSGAKAEHILDETYLSDANPQYPNSPDGVLGATAQIEALRTNEADIVLLDVGGNDAGFGEIGKGCALPIKVDCRRSAEEWMDRLDGAVFDRVSLTIGAVKEEAGPHARVYVLTYPNPLGPDNCFEVQISAPEMSFLRDVFIPRLNEIIRFSAAIQGVEVIDLENALAGRRLCEVRPWDAAINLVALGRTEDGGFGRLLDFPGGLAHATFHPNALGHEMMADVVAAAIAADETTDDGAPPRGPPGPDGPPPDLPPVPPGGIPDAPAADDQPSGTPPLPDEPPPFVPPEFGLPEGPQAFPVGTDCDGDVIDRIEPARPPAVEGEIELTGLEPGSTACYRSYQAEWRSRTVDGGGDVSIPYDDAGAEELGSINEVLVQRSDGRWHKLVVQRAATGDQRPASNARLALVLVVLAGVFALILTPLVLHRRRTRPNPEGAQPAG